MTFVGHLFIYQQAKKFDRYNKFMPAVGLTLIQYISLGLHASDRLLSRVNN